MGIIGDAFSKLFAIIWDFGEWLLGGIGSFFQVLIDLIIGFIDMIVDVIRALLYVVFMLGVLAVKLFEVILEAAQILWSLVVGFTRTLASLSYSGRSSGGHGYSDTISRLFDALEPMQLDVLAYVLSFSLWFITAVSAIKLISSIRVGGD